MFKCSFFVDLTATQTWFLSSSLKNGYSSTTTKEIKDNIQFKYNNSTFNAKEIEDNISIEFNEQRVLDDFRLILVNDLQRSEANGALGMAFSYPDEKYSIIHQLKNKGLIAHLEFSIIKNTFFVFGELPPEDKVNSIHSYCNVVGSNGLWNCRLSQARMQNTKGFGCSTLNEALITFTTSNSLNFVPKDFYQLIIYKFYEELAFASIELTNLKRLLKTEQAKIPPGNITFTIDNYAYTLNMDIFWDCFDGYCDLNLYENPNEDEWVLGTSFYHLFNVIFDYEQKKIHFYSLKNIKELSNINDIDYHRQVLFITLICILASGVGLSIYIIAQLSKRMLF